MAKCQSCGAWILFLPTRAGKRMPIDARPSRDGNVFVTADHAQALVLSGDDLARERAAGTPLRKSHFATCPSAKLFRRRKEK